MEMKIENDYLEIRVKSLGGELTKVYNKKNKVDYLFNGDDKYWGYQSPILFPIVGALENNIFRHEGKEYTLPKHGFGRISQFDLDQPSKNSIVATLKYSEETLKGYPFKFVLEITYTIIENSFKVNFCVKNLDNKDIFFCIGGHPSFNCPINSSGKFTDYYLEFDKKETAYSSVIAEDGFFRDEEVKILDDSNKINLKYDLFSPDALVFEDMESTKVTLKSDKFAESVIFDYEEFPIIAFWTKCKLEAPFVCIEPWFGHGDYKNYSEDFCERDGVVQIEKDNLFEASYKVTIL